MFIASVKHCRLTCNCNGCLAFAFESAKFFLLLLGCLMLKLGCLWSEVTCGIGHIVRYFSESWIHENNLILIAPLFCNQWHLLCIGLLVMTQIWDVNDGFSVRCFTWWQGFCKDLFYLRYRPKRSSILFFVYVIVLAVLYIRNCKLQ